MSGPHRRSLGAAALAVALGLVPTAGASSAPTATACAVTLKGSAVHDADRTGGVALVVGHTVTLRAGVTGCRRPTGAHLRVVGVRLAASGKPVGAGVRRDCAAGSTCTIRISRMSAGRVRYVAVLVGADGRPRSAEVRVVWRAVSGSGSQPGGGTPVGGSSGGGTTPGGGGSTGGGSTGGGSTGGGSTGGGSTGGGSAGGGSAGGGGSTGPVLTVTKVTKDGPDKDGCTATDPGLGGSAEQSAATKATHVTVRWTVPTRLTAGATAGLTVIAESIDTDTPVAWSAALKSAAPFGMSPADGSLTASAAGGESATATREFTFAPTRRFNAGEKLSLRVETGCNAYTYEYTAS